MIEIRLIDVLTLLGVRLKMLINESYGDTYMNTTKTTVEVLAADYDQDNTKYQISEVIASCGGFVQYVSDPIDGRILARIWYS